MNIQNAFIHRKTGQTIDKKLLTRGLKYEQTNDVFVRSDITKTLAENFRNKILRPYTDWENGIPSAKEEGGKILRDTLAPFTDIISKLGKKDTEHFIRLVFGENQAKQLEAGAKVNSDLMKFKTMLEQKVGKTIQEAIK